jgi:GTPase SAR1 family protein
VSKIKKRKRNLSFVNNSFLLFISYQNYNCRSEILGEVQKQGTTKLPSNKNLLVLGDNSSGKTSLIAKLQGVEDPKKGSGLEYAYIDVRDEYRDGKLTLFINQCNTIYNVISL